MGAAFTVNTRPDPEGMMRYFSALERDRERCRGQIPETMAEIRAALGQCVYIVKRMHTLTADKPIPASAFNEVRWVKRWADPQKWPRSVERSEIIDAHLLYRALNTLIGEMWGCYGETWPHLTNATKWRLEPDGRYRWIGNESPLEIWRDEVKRLIERLGDLAPLELCALLTKETKL